MTEDWSLDLETLCTTADVRAPPNERSARGDDPYPRDRMTRSKLPFYPPSRPVVRRRTALVVVYRTGRSAGGKGRRRELWPERAKVAKHAEVR